MRNGRKLAVWGYGNRGKQYVERHAQEIELIIDNDEKKRGYNTGGIRIVSPTDIGNIDEYFIVITVEEAKDIEKQCEHMGLIKGKDFVLEEYCASEIALEEVVDALKEICLLDEKKDLEINFAGKQDYLSIRNKYKEYMEYECALTNIYSRLPLSEGVYKGICVCCEKEVNFHIKVKPESWRETGVCPCCKLNSRMRFMFDYVRRMIPKDKSIYINEQTTYTYKAFARIFPNIVGSEYLSANCSSGEYVDGVLHEDAMNLSFEEGSFDAVISNDVFEHVANYNKAFSETYRVLKAGGMFIFSIPFYTNRNKTETVTQILDNGELQYLKPPVYHGNPLSKDGSLVFHEFSWDIVDCLKEVGFSEVKFVCYESAQKGYFGALPMIIVAAK